MRTLALTLIFIGCSVFCQKVSAANNDCRSLAKISSDSNLIIIRYYLDKYNIDQSQCLISKNLMDNEISLSETFSCDQYQFVYEIDRHSKLNIISIFVYKTSEIVEFVFDSLKHYYSVDYIANNKVDYFFHDSTKTDCFYCNLDSCNYCSYYSLSKEALVFTQTYLPLKCYGKEGNQSPKPGDFDFFAQKHNVLPEGEEVWYNNGVWIHKNIYSKGVLIRELKQ